MRSSSELPGPREAAERDRRERQSLGGLSATSRRSLSAVSLGGLSRLPLPAVYLGGLSAVSRWSLNGRRSSSRRNRGASSTRAPEPGGAGGRHARADADSAPAPRVGLHRRRGGADHGARLPRPDEARRAVRARRRPLPAAAARDGADGRRARHGDLPLLAAVPGAPRRRLPAPDAVPDGGRHHGHLVAARLLGRACLRLSGEGCPGHVHDMSGTCP